MDDGAGARDRFGNGEPGQLAEPCRALLGVSRAMSWPARARSGGESPCQISIICALIVAAASSCVRGELAAGIAGVADGAAPGGDSRLGGAPAGTGTDGGGPLDAADALGAAGAAGQLAGADDVGPLDAAGALGAGERQARSGPQPDLGPPCASRGVLPAAAHPGRSYCSVLQRSKIALEAAFRRIARHTGGAVAVFAIARKLAQLIYRMLRYGQDYVDIWENAYEAQFEARRLASLKEAARGLGYTLVQEPPVEG